MGSSNIRPLLPLLGALLAAACSAPTIGTRYGVGTFVLRTVDGQPLPALTQVSSTLRAYVLSDTIRWYSSGEYDEMQLRRDEFISPPSVAIQRVFTSGRYVVRGDSVQFMPDCPPNALCAAPPFASRAPDGTITTAFRSASGLSLVKRYQQVGFPPD